MAASTVTVFLEKRFLRLGRDVYAAGTCTYSFWNRYLRSFTGVQVCARVRNVARLPNDTSLSSGPSVAFVGLPAHRGLLQLLLSIPPILLHCIRAATGRDAIVFRAPTLCGFFLLPMLALMRRPYAVEVTGDPEEVFSAGGFRHVLRGLFKFVSVWQLKALCRNACAVSYVTSGYLQKKYPASPGAFAANYSSVSLSEEDFVGKHRRLDKALVKPRLLMIGSLEQPYKATDVLLRALADPRLTEYGISLKIIGEGCYRAEYETLAKSLNLAEQVEFCGYVSDRKAIRTLFDQADVFVLVSRTEGLPRAMIEAMARGLPCIGTRVGGIPELLAPADLVEKDDVEGLVQKLLEVLPDASRLTEMSRRNLTVAREYHDVLLQQRRDSFCMALRTATEHYLESRQ